MTEPREPDCSAVLRWAIEVVKDGTRSATQTLAAREILADVMVAESERDEKARSSTDAIIPSTHKGKRPTRAEAEAVVAAMPHFTSSTPTVGGRPLSEVTEADIPVTLPDTEPVPVTQADTVPCDCGCGSQLKRRPQYVNDTHRKRANRQGAHEPS